MDPKAPGLSPEWGRIRSMSYGFPPTKEKANRAAKISGEEEEENGNANPLVVVQLPGCVRVFETPWSAAHQASSISHHLLELAQVHVHCIGDAIQLSYPLKPSSSALDLCQYQGLFQWVVCSHQMTKILELQLQHQSFQWVFRVDLP